jgi:CAAX prenyl protease-like protein
VVSGTTFPPGGKSYLTPLFFRAAPFALFIALVALAHGPWATALRGVAVAALLLAFRRHYTELRLATAARAHDWLVAVAVGFAVFCAWIHLDRGWMSSGGGPGFDPTRPDGSVDWALAGLRLLGLALVVPVMEELFWRSFVMRWIDARDFLLLDAKRVTFRALVVSSALFASEHSLWLAGLVAGLGYSWVYLRSGNLWMPIVSHATTNGSLGIWILATGNWRFW